MLFESRTELEKALFDEAVDLLERSKPDEAIIKLFELLEIDSHSEYVDRVNILLAEAYREKREYKKGTDLLYSIIEKESVTNNDLTYAYTRIAALYNEWKYPETFIDSVVKYSEMSILNSKKNGFNEYLALSENELGHVLIQLEKYVEAQPKLIKALGLFLDLGMSKHAANVAINLSNSYLYLDNNNMAEQVIDEALLFCKEGGNENLFMRLYLQKAKVNQYVENYKDAYDYLSKSRMLRIDSEIVEMSAKYDLEMKEAKIREEKLKSEKKQNEVFVLMILIGILLLVLILGFIIFYLQRKNFKQKHKLVEMQTQILEKDYEIKNKELTTAIAGGIAMDKILEEVKGEITLKNYNKALNVINTGLSGDRKWQRFMLNFNKQNPDFFLKLQKRHPDLTENDTRLCAFLKMGLKTKEIASVLNIEISGVNKGRQRLRKKLNLKLKENIAEYLDVI